MDPLSSNALSVETTPVRKTFSQLASFAHQLRSSWTQLGRSVQAASTNIATSLSCMASGRGLATGKFNFGVGTEGKCGILWDKMESKVEAFHLNLVTTTYGEVVS